MSRRSQNLQLNRTFSIRIYFQGWVEKRSKRSMFSSRTNWRKRWLVLYTNGVLELFGEKPSDLHLTAVEATETYFIQPESTISREGDQIRLTWGEKANHTFQEKVFRPCLTIDENKVEKIEMGKTSNPVSEEWFKVLKEIALRKRLQFVLFNRDQTENIYSGFGVRGDYNGKKKKLSKLQDKKLHDKFHEDKRLLWNNAVQFDKSSSGDKIYFMFENQNLKILWKIYTDKKEYMGKQNLKELLFDAFVQASQKSDVNKAVLLSLVDVRAYNAKVYLDKDLDGKVSYNEFTKLNTKEFWLALDFLTPIDRRAATEKLWLGIFNRLEEDGALDPEIIYRTFEKYDSKEEGYLYQADIEAFLVDFMQVTPLKWPTVDKKQVQNFCNTIVVRGAIALRYLDVDETNRVSREEFNAIGGGDFWAHVDYITAVDTNNANQGVDEQFNLFGESEDEKNTSEMNVMDIVDNHHASYKSYSALRADSVTSDKVIARPSFNRPKYGNHMPRTASISELSPEKSLSPYGIEKVFGSYEYSTKSDGLKGLYLQDRAFSITSCSYNESEIDPRLLEMARVSEESENLDDENETGKRLSREKKTDEV